MGLSNFFWNVIYKEAHVYNFKNVARIHRMSPKTRISLPLIVSHSGGKSCDLLGAIVSILDWDRSGGFLTTFMRARLSFW